MEQATIRSIREELEAERAALARQLTEHGASVEGDEVQLHVSYSEVVGALERLEAGTYGRCERCGNEIAPERLEAIPTARLCVACKQATQ